MEKLRQAIAGACKDLFEVDSEILLTRPDEQFGDYSTNVALQLAKQLNKNPQEVAQQIAVKLQDPMIQKTEVAGPGFINITLTDEALLNAIGGSVRQSLQGKIVVAEYSDPNPFKVLHAGHLYTSIVGDTISRLYEVAGAKVHRVNFGGDVGLHVGRTMWAILQYLGGENPDKLQDISENDRSEWMSKAYITGTEAYEKFDQAKQDIIELNKQVYMLHAENDRQSPFAQIYWTCRQWSYDYFESFYKRIGSGFERYYPESEVAELGLQTVKEQLQKGVFEESNGAVIFPGEKYDLHTRVFINSEGLPTYEAKDIGLILQKYQDYTFDVSLVITGNEQVQYMEVVLQALGQFNPDLAQRTTHLTHGLVKMAGGIKMSSRKGNILRATDVLDSAAEANKKATGTEDKQVILAAVKYAFLKNRVGGDIIYSPEESVALEGNSGPYLQYSHARARSILLKKMAPKTSPHDLELGERSLARKISEYTETVEKAVQELMPHYIATYLYDLAQTFNRFYEKNRVIDDPREETRLYLVKAYADTLKNGLNLLNIIAPDKM